MPECVRCDELKKIGPMNRRVEIQEAVETQDAHGQPIEVWSTVRIWRAARRDLRGLERFRSQQELGERTTMFTGRWFSGANTKMRLSHDGMIWDVTGISEIGRRVALELTATVVRA